MGTHLRVLDVRAIEWEHTWQGLDGFRKSLHSCEMDKSSLSIRRVSCVDLPTDFLLSPKKCRYGSPSDEIYKFFILSEVWYELLYN